MSVSSTVIAVFVAGIICAENDKIIVSPAGGRGLSDHSEELRCDAVQGSGTRLDELDETGTSDPC